MARTERVYRIEMLIRSRRHVSFQQLLDDLEVSPATLKRDLAYLRDRLGAPIEYDRDLNGYRFGNPGSANPGVGDPASGARGSGSTGHGPRHELPGLWFSEPELFSLLVARELLGSLDDDGVLSRHLEPLQDRIRALLGASRRETEALLERVRIVNAARRPVPSRTFETIGDALLRRRRVHLRYLSRGRDRIETREISPQRLMHYRGAWYVDAWCHARDAMRRFALDAIQETRVLDEPAIDISVAEVEAAMDAGYGAYAGAHAWRAVLQFSSSAARWVSHETWHTEQRGARLPDGGYRLEIRYTDPTELAMDVMRYGDQVEIVEDDGPLRGEVRKRTRAAWRRLRRAVESGAG